MGTAAFGEGMLLVSSLAGILAQVLQPDCTMISLSLGNHVLWLLSSLDLSLGPVHSCPSSVLLTNQSLIVFPPQLQSAMLSTVGWSILCNSHFLIGPQMM